MALEGTETYTFDAEGSGTGVTVQHQRRSLWRLRLLDKLVDQAEGRVNERALERLKERMESTGAEARAAG